MRAEIIAIGDELTSGQRLDTNSQWLSRELAELGIRVVAHTTVADDLPMMVDAIRHACSRCEVVVCSGGLGPTADDLTREAFAQAAGVQLETDDAALAHIRSLFERRGREMPERNTVQAQFPADSVVIDNPHGSAPGFDISISVDGGSPTRFFALPGVPAELKEMYVATVGPAMKAALGEERKFIQVKSLKCFGIGESDMESRLPDLIKRGRTPTVGITVSRATITLRIVAEAASPDECAKQIAGTEETIRNCVGDLVFGEDEDEIQHAVLELLAASGQTMCVAEIGSGGLLSDWLSQADEDRILFKGGMIAAGNGAVMDMLTAHELEEMLETETFAAAYGVVTRESIGADYCLVIGEFPDPDAEDDDTFEGRPDRVEIVLIKPDGQKTKIDAHYSGHPDILRHRTVKHGLDLLRRVLMKRTGRV